VTCGVSATEIREAFLLNLNVRSCLKLTFSNGRLLTILLILVVSLVSQIVKGKADLGLFIVFLLPLAMILGLMWFNLSRSLAKTARAISASGAQMTIDTQGITTTLPDGTRKFEPWHSFTSWREGKLVFTVCNQKSYRTISKSALGIHAGELRGLLSHVCPFAR
jgi:hypothetical protein